MRIEPLSYEPMVEPSTDPYNLKRFLAAQAPVFDTVRAELRAGRKRSHWMWFIFPQIAGMAISSTARFYAIRSRDEAAAYLAHPVLGKRLVECTHLVNAVQDASISHIFGSPDDRKFHSCMTLFAAVASEQTEFSNALRKYFSGMVDQLTLGHI